MTQPEQFGDNQSPEAVESRTSRITEDQLKYLTGLALLDGSRCLGDQVRSALAAYAEKPYELRFRLPVSSREFFSTNPGHTIDGQRVVFSLAPEEAVGYDGLCKKAAQEGLHHSVGLFAVLGKYIDDRLDDPRTGAMAKEAIARLQARQDGVLPPEGPSRS